MTNQRLLCCSEGAATIVGLANQVMNINESGTVLRKKMLLAACGGLHRSLFTFSRMRGTIQTIMCFWVIMGGTIIDVDDHQSCSSSTVVVVVVVVV